MYYIEYGYRYEEGENPIVVTYPPLRLEDVDVRLNKAKVLIEAYARGMLPKKAVIQALIDLEIFDVGKDANEILEELEAEGGGMPVGGLEVDLSGVRAWEPRPN